MAYCFSFIQQQAIPLEQILDHREEIWNGYLRDVCEYGYQALATPELKPVMDSLCIFRYADEFVLQKIFVRSKSPVFHDEFELWDKLAQTNIFENRNRYLKDDISRRLLVIRLRQTQPASYQKLAGEARTICEKHLQQPDLQLPEDWVIEYLYQSLQMVVDGYAMSDQVRATLKRQFTRDLKKALTLYFDRPSFEKGAQRRNGLRILISKMEEDDQWEFRFLVNYLQCGSDFTDAPFTQLLKDVAAWPL